MNQYVQCLPAECVEHFETPLMDISLLDVGQFNDWNEKIEWFSMLKYVTINWWERNYGLESTVHVVRHGRVYRRHQHTMGNAACAWSWENPLGAQVIDHFLPATYLSVLLLDKKIDKYWILLLSLLLLNSVITINNPGNIPGHV